MPNRRSSLREYPFKQPTKLQRKKYFGIEEESLKGRIYKHSLSFGNEFYKSDTELSKDLWQIKMKSYTPEINNLENYQTMYSV